MKTEIHVDAIAAAHRAAGWIAEVIANTLAMKEYFVLALSGGTTPLPMLRRLAQESIDWRRVHIIQVDERVAPADSPDRSFKQLQDVLLCRVPIPSAQVHPMPVESANLAAAAHSYARLLAALAGTPAEIDLIQLGLGADGHTASLVPGDAALDVSDVDVAVSAIYHGRQRMTLAFPAINRARHILWLVTGEDKADALVGLVAGDPRLPASRVRPERALLLADRPAAVNVKV